jgi:hypothetical protein
VVIASLNSSKLKAMCGPQAFLLYVEDLMTNIVSRFSWVLIFRSIMIRTFCLILVYLHLEHWTSNATVVDFKVTTVVSSEKYRFGVWLTQIDCSMSNVLKGI